MKQNALYSPVRLTLLVLLRVAIGWHLMYEGIAKILQPGWSAFGYLMDAKGWFATFFNNMAQNPGLLKVVDFLNIWGLTLIGLSMITGLFSRYAKAAAMVILLFYYLAHPPLMTVEYIFPGEGSYLWVNKNLVELLAVAVLFVFPTGHIIGLDRFIKLSSKKNGRKQK